MNLLASSFLSAAIASLFLFIVPAYASDPALDAQIRELSKSRHWHRILHYKRSTVGKLRSEVDGRGFFFSPEGKTEPELEMRASVEAMAQDIRVGKLKLHPQCAFPERYRFLKAELKLSTKDVPCPEVEDFLKRYNPESATLVFSSAYPNNPGSMFGHTFLRINAMPDPKTGKKLDILDYGVSYAAAVGDDENNFAFIWFGLTGGYLGRYSMLPYYSKVNEYTNAESRDLWEYDLNITPAETRRMLAHLWEIETNGYLDYYFFDENCAYVLLTALEVAKPDWDISNFGPYVIPSQTVKRLVNTPGAVRSVKFRPSLRKKLFQRYEGLSSEQKDRFLKLVNTREGSEEVLRDPALLEATTAYLFYQKQKNDGKLAPEDSSLLRQALLTRSQLGSNELSTGLPAIPEDSRPDLGHHTYRLGTAGGLHSAIPGKGSSQYFQDLSFKFAFHDLMNKDLGYTRYSQIDFPGATLRYYPKDGKLNVENITPLAITSLFPMSFVEQRLSWTFHGSYFSPKDYACTYCHLFQIEGGAGATFELFTPNAVIYSLVLFDLEAGDTLRKGFRVMPKLRLATLLNPIEDYKLQLSSTLVTDVLQSDRQKIFYLLEANQSFSLSQAWEIRAGYSQIVPTAFQGRRYHEGKATLNFYF